MDKMKILINIDNLEIQSFLKNKLFFKKNKNLLVLENSNENLYFLKVLTSLEILKIKYDFAYKKVGEKRYNFIKEFKILSNQDFKLKNRLFNSVELNSLANANDILAKKLSSKEILEDNKSFDEFIKIINMNTKIYIYDENFQEKEIYLLNILEYFSNIKNSLKEIFQKRFKELQKMKRLEKDKAITFLRFGDIPKNEKSYSHIYNRFEEKGVSVFYKNEQGFPIFSNLLQFRGFVDRYFGEHPEYDSDLYILNEYVGNDTFFKGDDDEPLIKDCKIIKRNLRYDDKVLKRYLINFLKENFVNFEKNDTENWHFKDYGGIFNADEKLVFGGYEFSNLKNDLKFKYM